MKDVLRRPETIKRYREERQRMGEALSHVDLKTATMIREYVFWVLVENKFPYDMIAETHSLLVPKRWFTDDWDMNEEERGELFQIKEGFGADKTYDTIFENVKHKRTVP